MIDHRRAVLIRARVGAGAAVGDWAGYGALAAEHLPPGSGRIAALTGFLETVMDEDAAAGRPFLAAACAARVGHGMPAPGFFLKAAALGRHDGSTDGPAAEAFVAQERAALRAWLCGPWPEAPDAVWAVARYEEMRATLPRLPARASAAPLRVPDLSAVAGRYDGFVLDAYGVLNTGDTAIPGAVARIAQLRVQGKRLVVLTNGASLPLTAAVEKYRRWGFDFSPHEVIASRELAAAALAGLPPGPVAAIGAPGAPLADLPRDVCAMDAAPELLADAAAFLFLSSDGWTPARHAALCAALVADPRPLVVANPDVTAPLEQGFTLEPGHFARHLAEATASPVLAHGKPFGPAFDAAVDRLGLARDRVAMVGDSLHTDILGGRAAGLGTVLIAAHGLFRGRDPMAFATATGIVPDVIATTT